MCGMASGIVSGTVGHVSEARARGRAWLLHAETSWCAGAVWVVQANEGRWVAEGSDCGTVQEKYYLAAVKRTVEMSGTPPGSPMSAQVHGEWTKEPLTVGSS